MGGVGGWREQLYTSGRDVAANAHMQTPQRRFQSKILPSLPGFSPFKG